MKEFLGKYDTVIFDLDGVITSEEAYWDAAALTVWEYLKYNRNIHIDAKQCMDRVDEIRSKVFCEDKLITLLKNKGINSNWDLAYVVVLIALLNDTEDFNMVYEYAKNLGDNAIDIYNSLPEECSNKKGYDLRWLERNGVLWQTLQGLFQEWYLGEDKVDNPAMHKDKTGLVNREKPLLDIDKVTRTLRELSKDHRLCTGTGRPYLEMETPLRNWGIYDLFDPMGLSNYDYVVKAETKLNMTLTKPNPYMFLKALYGTNYDDGKIVNGDYDKAKIEKALVVGDAGADILAARAMGADFCAVLTGINGKSARGFFEEMKAEYILESVCDLV